MPIQIKASLAAIDVSTDGKTKAFTLEASEGYRVVKADQLWVRKNSVGGAWVLAPQANADIVAEGKSTSLVAVLSDAGNPWGVEISYSVSLGKRDFK